MSEPDDRLRDLYRQGRAPDSEEAPEFGAVWDAAEERQRRRWFSWGTSDPLQTARRRCVYCREFAAVAAIVVLAAWFVWPNDNDVPAPTEQKLAETRPLPDVPADDDPEELELAEADWSGDDGFDVPTDFLLESDGLLAGGLPSTDFDDPVFDLEDGMETEL